MSTATAWGCDLGTNMSCAAIWKDGHVEVIANAQGNRITPSYVGFANDGERLVGDAAKNQAPTNALRTIYDAKRLIGRKFSDSTVQEDIKVFPFKVVDDGKDRPMISVDVMGDGVEKKFYPEEISAMVLGYMKEQVEAFMGKEMKDVVITVPAYFNDAQRQSTKDSAVIAGLNCLRIINEPTAAALAYGLDKKANGEQKVLVFDLGGGTFDVTILSIEDGIFEVLATGGNSHLGGSNFDTALVQHFATEFKRKYKKDLTESPRALGRLKAAAERAKKALSSAAQTSVECDALYDGIDFTTSITRARFEELNMHFFRECLDCVERVMKDAKLDKGSIHEIVLVGGSSRIPKVQTMLQEFFGGKELNKGVSYDEGVAYGAAVQSHVITGGTDDAVKDLLLLDVCPLSLSIETAGGVATVLIPRNTTIPVTKTQTFSTYADNQKTAKICLGQGERAVFAQNTLLGSFELTGIPDGPRGSAQLEVTVNVSADSIVEVTAVEKSTGKSNKIVVKNDSSRLSKEDIQKAVEEAEKYAEQDKKIRERIERKNELEGMIHSLKTSIVDSGKASPEDTEKAKKVLEDARNWLDDNGETASVEDIDDRIKGIQDVTTPVLMKLYQAGGAPEGGVPGGVPMGDMPTGQGAPDEGGKGPVIEEELD